ncbi:unnamed protein product [Schistosoma spindalis]|nr:unnamed protein product [Schistosoma spindale]
MCNVVEIVPDNPIVIMRWDGYQPELPAIMLNSHMDVVPVVEEKWSYPPFSGTITPDGKIYGRGTQDMKSIGIQQLEAIRRLKSRGCHQLRRTVYLTFVPDEELGGVKGMKPFVSNHNECNNHHSEEIRFQDMNIGLCLDEGIPSCSEDYLAFYDERRPVWINVHFHGNAGHGLALIENTAAEKFRIFLNNIYSFRKEEQLRLENSLGKLTLGDITTVNMTMINGGVQHNVVPEQLSASFDIRLTPSLSLDDFKKKLDQWALNAGGHIERGVYPQVKNCSNEIRTYSFFSIFSIYSFRKEEQLRLENSLGKLTLGDITTVNMTMINGGVQHNVVPEQLSASFDIRLTPSLSLDDFKKKLDQWALNAGGHIERGVYPQVKNCSNEIRTYSFFSIFSIYSFRKEEQLRLENSLGKLTLGDITTVNMTMINGGVQHNVVPEQLSASFDIRLTPSLSLDDFKKKLDQWALNAGGHIEVSFQKLTVFCIFYVS